MTYILKVRTATSVHTYSAIGDLGRLIDAAYDAGALGVTATVKP